MANARLKIPNILSVKRLNMKLNSNMFSRKKSQLLTFEFLVKIMRPPFVKVDEGSKHEKWSSDNDAALLLREGVRSGDIDLSLALKQIWSSNPVFAQHELDSFQSFFMQSWGI